jgi:F0F1-type ATP synthase assembly protein I
MTSLRKNLGKRAVKATARHSWRGLAAKAQRQPLRSASLLTAGGVVGLMAGWLAGRKTARPA